MSDDTNPIETVRERLNGGRGWHQGYFTGPNDTRCLWGACDTGAELEALWGPVLKVAREQFPERFPGDGLDSGIVTFNDHPLTTWPDVDLVLDKAARQWDETHGGAL